MSSPRLLFTVLVLIIESQCIYKLSCLSAAARSDESCHLIEKSLNELKGGNKEGKGKAASKWLFRTLQWRLRRGAAASAECRCGGRVPAVPSTPRLLRVLRNTTLTPTSSALTLQPHPLPPQMSKQKPTQMVSCGQDQEVNNTKMYLWSGVVSDSTQSLGVETLVRKELRVLKTH